MLFTPDAPQWAAPTSEFVVYANSAIAGAPTEKYDRFLHRPWSEHTSVAISAEIDETPVRETAASTGDRTAAKRLEEAEIERLCKGRALLLRMNQESFSVENETRFEMLTEKLRKLDRRVDDSAFEHLSTKIATILEGDEKSRQIATLFGLE